MDQIMRAFVQKKKDIDLNYKEICQKKKGKDPVLLLLWHMPRAASYKSSRVCNKEEIRFKIQRKLENGW